MKQKDIDNILKANKKLDWVKRLYEENTPSIVLPGQDYPSTHYMESSDNLVYPTIIRNADGKLEYLGNKARDYAIKTNTAIKLDTEEDAAWFGENYKQGTDVLKQFKKGGKITAETIYSMSEQPKVILTPDDIKAESGFNFQKYFPMERDIPVDTTTSYNRDIDRFAWKNTLQNLPEIQKQQQVPNQQIDSSYYTQKTPKGYFNVYDKDNQLVGYSMDNKTIVKQEPNFEKGGMIQAWIQKFVTGGKVYADGGANPYIDPYAGMTEFNPEMQTNMQSMSFQKLQTQPINQSFNNLQPKQFNTQMQVPVAQSNMQPYSTPYQTNYDASNDQVNMDNKQADSMMTKSTKIPNPADAILGGVNAVGDVATGAISAFAKPGSKGAAYAEGSAKAQSVVKPLEKIPIVGQASKLISGIIGGALNARKQGIEDEENKKMENQDNYNRRNALTTAQQPSYYGQYMAKYGSNIKNLEQRLIDDIFSDYDKFMKLT